MEEATAVHQRISSFIAANAQNPVTEVPERNEEPAINVDDVSASAETLVEPQIATKPVESMLDQAAIDALLDETPAVPPTPPAPASVATPAANFPYAPVLSPPAPVTYCF